MDPGIKRQKQVVVILDTQALIGVIDVYICSDTQGIVMIIIILIVKMEHQLLLGMSGKCSGGFRGGSMGAVAPPFSG